jgi:LacI family transcriptional regulator
MRQTRLLTARVRTTDGGRMAATLTEVARGAGVALSTASRAFSDPDRLGPQTLRKVLTVAQELGYQPSVARLVEPLSDDGTTTVAVIVPDIANPVFAAFLKAAQGQGWYRRQTVVLADTDLSADRERDVISHLRERVDGMVLCSPRLAADDILAMCSRIPVVLVNREAPGTDCVVADSNDGLRQTIDYLAALGHVRIAYVQGSQLSWSNEHRVGTVRSLAAEAGVDLEVLGSQAETVAGGTAAAASVVATGASAVITHNDLMALGVVAGARALGVQVPGDLSVVGIDDIPLAAITHPTLTTVAVPMARAGALSLELLEQRLSGDRQPPRSVRLPTQLVVRGSTGTAAATTVLASGRPA